MRKRIKLAVALELLKKGCSIQDLNDRNLPIPSLQKWRKDHIRFEDEKQTFLPLRKPKGKSFVLKFWIPHSAGFEKEFGRFRRVA